jgi:hypothetical protein
MPKSNALRRASTRSAILGGGRSSEEVETVQVTIRVPYEWLERADRVASDLSPIGKKLTRMDGFRAVIVMGFESHIEHQRQGKQSG